MELRISDVDADGFLISISKVLTIIINYDRKIIEGKWTLWWFDQGFGGFPENFCDTHILANKATSVSKDYLLAIAKEECLDITMLELKKIDNSFKVGVFDSEYVYINAEEKLLNDIAKSFLKCEIVQEKS